MYWNCFFVFKNSCTLKGAHLWLCAMIFVSVIFLCSLSVSLFLPVCFFDMSVKQQRNEFNIEMVEPMLDSTGFARQLRDKLTMKRLQKNISELSRELRQLRFTVRVHEKLGKVMEKDSSLVTFGSKLHQNVLLMSVPHSGSVFLGELFNRNPDVFYLFEPFHSLKYFRVNRPPEIYDSMISSFMQGIFTCEFSKFRHFTEFLSRHYRALIYRLSSRTLSLPPLCPEVVSGKYYNIRQCSYLRPPTLSAICKLHSYTVVKTTQIIDLERLSQLVGADGLRVDYSFRVVDLVRDPRAIVYMIMLEEHGGNVSESFFADEGRKICTQQLRNINYSGNLFSSHRDSYIMIRYEDLISHPVDTVNTLFDFIGISDHDRAHSWVNDVLKHGFTWPEALESAHTVNSDLTIRKNLMRSVAEWRTGLKDSHIRAVERECLESMRLLGYEIF